MFGRIKSITKRLFSILKTQDVMVLPGQIAFFLILSIFPMLILIGLIVSKFSMPLDQLLSFLEDILPSNIYDIINPFISGKGFDTNVGFFMLLGFFMASNGTHSIILASNKLYGFKNSDYLKRRIKAAILILLVIFMLLFTMIILAFGDHILKLLFDLFNVKNMSLVYTLFDILKWPVTMFMLIFILKLVYVISPDKKIMSRYTTRGALFATISIMIITFIYSHFLLKFNNYNIFYGSLSNIAIMMMWVYFVSYVIVIGIAINVNDYNNKELIKNENE